MTKLVVPYKKPADTAAFDSYYFSTHFPIAKKIAGLRRYEVSSGPVASPAGDSRFHLVAVLSFDSLAALRQAMASPDSAAAAADVVNFARAGVRMLIFDTKEV